MVSLAGLSAVPDAYNAAQGDQFALQQAARQAQAKAVIGKVLQALVMRQQGGGQPPMGGGMPQQPQMSPMQGRFADAFQGTPNARPQLDNPAAQVDIGGPREIAFYQQVAGRPYSGDRSPQAVSQALLQLGYDPETHEPVQGGAASNVGSAMKDPRYWQPGGVPTGTSGRPQPAARAPATGGGVSVPPGLQSVAPGSLTWDRVVNAIAQANPGIDPALLAETVNQFEPLMARDSAEKWKGIDAQYRNRALAQSGRIASQRAGGAASDPLTKQFGRAPMGKRWRPDGTLELIQTLDASGKPVVGTGKPTEQQLRNRQLYKVAKPEAERLLGTPANGKTAAVAGTFDALTGAWNQALGGMEGLPIIGDAARGMQSSEYQSARSALQTIISSYLYSTSGATANPAEVLKQTDILTPKWGEHGPSLDDKKRRIRTMVDAIREAAMVESTGDDPPLDEGGDPPPDGGDAGEPQEGDTATGPDGTIILRNGRWEPLA